MIARISISHAMLLVGIAAFAQSSGIRAIFPEFSKVYADKDMWTPFNIGMGYDHDFNDRISMGFDATISLQRSADVGREIYVDYLGYSASFYSNTRSLGVQYRTGYAFAGNEGTSVYLGTFIGMRYVRQELTLVNVNYNNNFSYDNGPFQYTELGKRTMFPIGLRAGVRGSLEGGYVDLYAQLGHVIGGGGNVFDRTYFIGEEFELSNMAFTIGFAYGVGW